MLDDFLKEKQTDEDNLWDCDNCNKRVQPFKFSEILSPPRHLCICLSRLEYVMTPTFHLLKKTTKVEIEPMISIGMFTYDLYFIVVHEGKN